MQILPPGGGKLAWANFLTPPQPSRENFSPRRKIWEAMRGLVSERVALGFRSGWFEGPVWTVKGATGWLKFFFETAAGEDWKR